MKKLKRLEAREMSERGGNELLSNNGSNWLVLESKGKLFEKTLIEV